jgi:two-component system OmpR family sensor kinase
VRRLLPTSLSARLVTTAVALVALVAALLGVATTLAMRSYLYDRLDAQVHEALVRATLPWRFGYAPLPPSSLSSRGALPAAPDGDGDGSGQESGDEGGRSGQGAGTITAVWDGYGARGEMPTTSGERRLLSAAALAVLVRVPADGHSHAVQLRDMGSYRVQAATSSAGKVVTGLPTGDIRGTLARLVGLEVVLALGGVVLAGAAGWWLVRRQLAPLREVADTAHTVAGLPLATGEIGVTARVPERLTDERTEVGQVGAALNTLLGHVERALDARHRSEQQVRQFVADASHELRTPLATIQGYAELGTRAAEPDADQLATGMGKVRAEASRMSSLVEDLLLLARLDAGRPLEREEVDLTRLVLESVEDARIVDPGHRWLLDLPDEPVTITGDGQRLHQVVTNLLSNARRHTPAGTTVTAGVCTTPRGQALVTVHDDGPGIPTDLQGSVFERFTRGDSARTRESGGAGLGLSLVQAITDAHGGDIAVTSRPGSTTFTLTLPMDGRSGG